MCTSTRQFIDLTKPFTIGMPYQDTSFGGYTVCSKEVLLQSWINKVGTYIHFDGISKRVTGVSIRKDIIMIDLE